MRLDRARRRLQSGDVAGARKDCEAVLAAGAATTERVAAHLVLASCHGRSGDLDGAWRQLRAALALAPQDPVVHYALAEIEERAGRPDAAVTSLRQAVELNPSFLQGHHYLGILLAERGQLADAVAAFEQVVKLDPGHSRGWNNLGNAQRSLGQLADAERSFARAVHLRPDYQLAAANLGSVQRDLGEVARAEETLRAALARQSGSAVYRPVLVLLAGLLRERGAFDEAAQLYRRAIDLAPGESGSEWFSLGWVLSERCEMQAARDAYARCFRSDPRDLRGLLGSHLALPRIHQDVAALKAARAAFETGLETLERELPGATRKLTEAQVLDGFRWTNFLLAYQGRNDRDLQVRYAALVAQGVQAVAPQWRAPLARRESQGRRIRIGFASAFFHEGTCGRYFQSWITDLPRDRFEVFVYHLLPGMDDVASAVERRADRFRTFGGMHARPSVVAPVIRDDELDVLIYPEVGMDATSFALAALRLAPRQCAGWGHPVTTGHATIDGYITCDPMEPAGGEEDYAEPLIRLPGIGTRYRRFAIPGDAERARLGLPEGRTLMLCPQSLFKIHPDADAMFARALTEVPDGILILFAGQSTAITEQFMRRLSRTFERHGMSAMERTRVMPPVGHDDFLRVNLACDIMLDTPHWSGGNTTLDALACGLPVVTLPGRFMRGRQSAAMLTMIGVPELVARDEDDYVRIVGRLAGDSALRGGISAQIRAGKARLFDDPVPVSALANAIERLVRYG